MKVKSKQKDKNPEQFRQNRNSCQLCFIPSSSSQEDSQFFNQLEIMAAMLNVGQDQKPWHPR